MKALGPEEAIGLIETVPVYVRDIPQAPRYAVCQIIQTANLNPEGHTRLPRYARGKKGLILEHYRAQVFPDTLAMTGEECPQHLYLVRFSAKELWGSHAGNFSVCLSLFEQYIDEVATEKL